MKKVWTTKLQLSMKSTIVVNFYLNPSSYEWHMIFLKIYVVKKKILCQLFEHQNDFK
jgi:hypothetical protein